MNNNNNYFYDEILSELLDSAGIEIPDSVTDLQFSDMTDTVLTELEQQIHTPLQIFSVLTGIIFLSALAGNLRHEKSAVSRICDMTAVLCAAGTVILPITEAFRSCTQILEQTAGFMTAFSGVFGGILAVSGHLTASAGYQGAMLLLCNIALEIAVKILFPFLMTGIAVSLTDAVNPEISLSGILKFIQKLTVWILGFLMSLFLGFLSVQSVITVSADRAGTKAAKYAISGFVPFIGGAVSDAYAAVLGSMSVLKSAVGVTGIIAILILLLPVMIKLFLYKMLMALASGISELFGLDQLCKLFQNTESVLSIGFSVSVSFSVMFIIGTGLLITIAS